MTDKIREAFENTPRCTSDGDFGSFEAGWNAALSSLEQVGTAAVACNTLSVGWTEVLDHNEKLYRIRKV